MAGGRKQPGLRRPESVPAQPGSSSSGPGNLRNRPVCESGRGCCSRCPRCVPARDYHHQPENSLHDRVDPGRTHEAIYQHQRRTRSGRSAAAHTVKPPRRRCQSGGWSGIQLVDQANRSSRWRHVVGSTGRWIAMSSQADRHRPESCLLKQGRRSVFAAQIAHARQHQDRLTAAVTSS
jgi:hypothetical protein